MNIKVILADDHAVVREGIKAIIGKKGGAIAVIGEAANGHEALKISHNNPADVYILDIAMPVLNGIETTKRLIRRDSKSKVIMLSMHDDKTYIEKALKSGAKGYVLKETATEEIIYAINEVYAGRYFLTSKISSFLIEDYLTRSAVSENTGNLTSREKGILQMLAEGLNNKEIAEKLALSLHTVHVHRTNIMRKLNFHRQTDLIRYALKEGIITL